MILWERFSFFPIKDSLSSVSFCCHNMFTRVCKIEKENKTNLKFRLGVMRAPSPFILILILSVVAFSLRYSSTCSFISSFTALTFAPVAFPGRLSIWQIFACAAAVMYEIVRHVSAFFSIYLPYFVSRLHECRVSTDKQNWSLEYP